MLKLTMLMSSGPLTEIKFMPDSLAIAFASRVLPQPGGPASSTPDGKFKPRNLNCSGYLTGAYNRETIVRQYDKYKQAICIH